MRKETLLAIALLALGAAAPGRAQTATLVDDLNPGAWKSGPPEALHLFAAGGRLFFTDLDSGEPAEVDPFGTGSALFADLCPYCASSPEYLGSLGRTVLFVESPDLIGTRTVLYRTDGTRAGTYSLGVPVDRPSVPLQPSRRVFAGGLFFFLRCDLGDGCELWRTDGTLPGTGKVKDFAQGSASGPSIDGLTAVGRRVFFFLDSAVSSELWTSDGTAAGTHRVLAGPGLASLTTGGGSSRFYFFGLKPPDSVAQLWASDGSATGTRPLTHFQNLSPFAASTLQVQGDQAYVVADDVVHGNELWASDGTAAGTRRVTDFGYFTPFTLSSFSSPTLSLVKLGDRLVFAATDGLHGAQVWASSGTPESTLPLAPAHLRGRGLVPVAGGRAVFLAQGDAGAELWGTDGTPAGTRRLPLPCARCTPGDADPLPLQGLAFFTFANPAGIVSLGASDGTPAGTQRFGDPLPGSSGTQVGELAMAGGQLFFTLATADDGDHQLWTSDGRPGGTRPVPGLDSGGSSDPSDLVALGGRLAFTACDGQSRQVYSSAGTPATTARQTDLQLVVFPPGCNTGFEGLAGLTATATTVFFWFVSNTSESELWRLLPAGGAERLADLGRLDDATPQLVPFGDRVYFAVQRIAQGERQIWQSDGTLAGTAPATELAAVPCPFRGDRAGDTLYLQGFSAAGNELWASDGTAAGTRRLLVTQDPIEEPADKPFVQAGPWVFFFAPQNDFRTYLWRTDGTAAGTGVVRDLTPPSGSLQPLDLIVLGGTLYFFANTDTGRGLFRSDGTAAGTVLVREFRRDLDFAFNHSSAAPAVFAGRLFFAADDGVHGRELWTSDGTAAGTVMVANINPGPAPSNADDLTVVGGRLYFSAFDPVHGSELWQSDGTAAGTRLAADLAPESASSHPQHLTAVGSRLYFAADDGISGNELWTIDTAAPSACVPGDTRLCLAGNRFQVEVDWKDFQGNTGVGHAATLTADTGTFWFFSPTNVELVVKVLDARSLNNAFWVFYGALSSVDYTITVTDTATGLSRRYHNPSGQLASVGDTNGFGPLGAFDTKVAEAPAPGLPLISARTEATPAASATSVTSATGTCTSGPGKLCLAGNRFAVTAAWKDFSGHTGTGTAVPLTGDTGYFWFFSPENVEVMTKVLDGRGLNGKFWLFYGALSNVEYTLTVTDTQTGAVKTYKNPSGQFGSVADTGAF